MNTLYDADGFFPEREILRARRLRAIAPDPVDTSKTKKASKERTALWLAVSVAAFLPMFVNAVIFGHATRIAWAVGLCVVAAGCATCVAVSLFVSYRRLRLHGDLPYL